jgi:pyrroloquinoline-quinone synthase
VRTRSLVEAVASSLTEMFAPDIMSKRIASWEEHYAFIDPQFLAYFRTRVRRARTDGEEALAFVVRNATTEEMQAACVRALADKCAILWDMLDAIASG